MKKPLGILIVLMGIGNAMAQEPRTPSFEEVIALQSVSNPVISPDGTDIVFESRTVDWEENRYDRELWISKDGGAPFQLTNNIKNNSSGPKWSPNGEWIAFLSKRGENTQIQVIRSAGGESFQVTRTKGDVYNFQWSPDGKQIAFLQPEDRSKEKEERKEKFGSFAVEDAEYGLGQLWVTDFEPGRLDRKALPDQLKDSVYTKSLEAKMVLDSVPFSINDYEWSPDGKKLAIEHQPDPLRNTFFKADISIYDIASKTLSPLVNNLSYDGLVGWSPDGKSVLYQTSLNDSTSNYYRNGKLFRIDVDGSGKRQLAADFDENLSQLRWNEQGIFGVAWQRTKRPMVKISPKNGRTTVLSHGLERVWGYSFSDNGKKMGISGVGNDNLTEIYMAHYPPEGAARITASTEQIQQWAISESEVVSWKSQDGAVIEGVLHKPQDYDPTKKYPLMVVIHGGPAGISTPTAVPSGVYPMLQWLNKGALVLQPNYRGSAGYGETFRSLNVRNLGVGDAWDVESGVAHLVEKGMVDSDKVAAMGWSQGGYISAFLTTNSDTFTAISVGAGISNWMTYYVNTDIHPFTRQYLKATPWSDKAIYEKTSPMTNINNASTPTLIQHGEFDKRVPTANAYELFQGLQDVGAETKLIIYKGFGHGISKPKERLAAIWHNWQWFGKHIWGEEIEIPMK